MHAWLALVPHTDDYELCKLMSSAYSSGAARDSGPVDDQGCITRAPDYPFHDGRLEVSFFCDNGRLAAAADWDRQF